MWPSREDLDAHGSDPSEKLPNPEEEAAFEARVDAVFEQKRQALAEPGLTWKEWFFYDAAKWWVGLLFLIVDIWIFAFWYGIGSTVGLAASLVAGLYLEFLLFRFLWYRPSSEEPRRRSSFRPSFLRPVPYGRWTPEAAGGGAMLLPAAGETGPDPKEFL